MIFFDIYLFKRNDIQEKLKKTIFGVDLYKDSKELPELNGNPAFKTLLDEIENYNKRTNIKILEMRSDIDGFKQNCKRVNCISKREKLV